MADSRKKKSDEILKNSIHCKYCGRIIESKIVHNFVTCCCGGSSVAAEAKSQTDEQKPYQAGLE